jgi:hypothetical protein
VSLLESRFRKGLPDKPYFSGSRKRTAIFFKGKPFRGTTFICGIFDHPLRDSEKKRSDWEMHQFLLCPFFHFRTILDYAKRYFSNSFSILENTFILYHLQRDISYHYHRYILRLEIIAIVKIIPFG